MRLIVCLMLACVTATAHGADRDLRTWAMESMGRGCEIHTFAYSADGENRFLFVHWAPEKGYVLSAWGPPVDGAVIVESIGTRDSFAVSPVNLHDLLKAAAVETLIANLARGVPIQLTLKPANQEAEVFTTQGANSTQAVAALAACVDMLKRHPVPDDVYAERGHYIVAGAAQGCELERFWRTTEGAFTITLKATSQAAAVEFARALSMHGGAPAKPFMVDARNFYGQQLGDMRTVRIELSEAQLGELESDLQAGKSRTFDLTGPDASPETLTFGSPEVRAPAAMFMACRKALVAEQTAANQP